jgi:hypothetical protein
MMKTAIKPNLSAMLAAGAAVGLALAAMSFAGSAQARDNVQWSVGVGVPGAVVNVGTPPVYVQPAPVYVQPAPVFVQPRPVFVQPQAVYVAPQPVYYEHERRHGHKWHRDHEHEREGWGGDRHEGRGRDNEHHRGHGD